MPRVYLDVPTCKYEAIQTSRAVRRVHSVFKLVALRVMSLYSALGAYWDTYSNNMSTWVAWAAASAAALAPVKPLLVDFLTFHVFGERKGIHFSSFLMLAIMQPCHLLAVVSETDLVSPSFFSSIIKGLSCPTLEVMVDNVTTKLGLLLVHVKGQKLVFSAHPWQAGWQSGSKECFLALSVYIKQSLQELAANAWLEEGEAGVGVETLLPPHEFGSCPVNL